MQEKEKEKIKALIEAVRALQEDGYTLSHGDHFKDTTAISESGNQFKLRSLNFSLYKKITLEGEEEELMELIQSLDRSYGDNL
jgi:hypothetical protein